MDKVQKQLIDTYIRKRGIANVQNIQYEFETYEILYLINNNIPFDLSTLRAGTIAGILVKQPSLVNKLDLSKLSYEKNNSVDRIYSIIYILKHQPQLFNYFDISNFDGYNIAELLIAQPLLIDKVDISILNDENIVDILKQQPKLSPQLAKYLY